MANITEHLKKVLSAVYGRDVRQNYHDALKAINEEAENTTARQGTIENRQNILETRYNNQIKNITDSNPSNVEIVDMRTNAKGETFTTAGARLNGIDLQLEETVKSSLCLKNVVQYGADNTGTNDITDLLLELIDTNTSLYFPQGKYKVNSEILKENLSNFIICGAGDSTIILKDSSYNCFKLNNCNNFKVFGINLEYEKYCTTTDLYKGGLAYITNCNNFELFGCGNKDTAYLFTVKDGNDYGKVYSNTTKINIPGTLEEATAYSSIIIYASKNIEFYGNTSIGSLKDGIFSIFGGDCANINAYGNRIINNRKTLTTGYNSQGFTIEQGCINVNVHDNYIENCYYGADIKADSHTVKCHDNMFVGCKVSIAQRKGEYEGGSQSDIPQIYNNTIIISDSDKFDSDSFYSMQYVSIGILNESQWTTGIHDNHIIYKNTTPIKVCGIYLKGVNYEIDNMKYINVIRNNSIELEYSFANHQYYPSSGSCNICLDSASNVCITNNNLRTSSAGYDGLFTMLVIGNNENIVIKDNNVKNNNINNVFIKGYENASLKNSIIKDNVNIEVNKSFAQCTFTEGVDLNSSTIVKDNYGFNNGGNETIIKSIKNINDTIKIKTKYSASCFIEFKGTVHRDDNIYEPFMFLISSNIGSPSQNAIIKNITGCTQITPTVTSDSLNNLTFSFSVDHVSTYNTINGVVEVKFIDQIYTM